jgi:hypothetical protein
MVGLLGRVISPSQGLYLNTGQHKRRINAYTHQTIHALCGIRTHEPGFRASEDSSCFIPLGYRDQRFKIYCGKYTLLDTWVSYYRKSSFQYNIRRGAEYPDMWHSFSNLNCSCCHETKPFVNNSVEVRQDNIEHLFSIPMNYTGEVRVSEI